MRENHIEHITHLRKHRNYLYGIVVMLLVLQFLTFVTFSSRLARTEAGYEQAQESVNNLDSARKDMQFGINELVKEVARQKQELTLRLDQQESSFSNEILALKVAQADFSEVIEEVIKGVVTISTDVSSATGFIVRPDGYIITNSHILDGSSYVRVLTYDGSTYEAEIIGQDGANDLALLKIAGLFYHVELANSDLVQPGEKVIAIGNPLGLSFSVTEGIVSAIHREGPNGQPNYIQTDVTLNPGNSGGPLINKNGQVIGINNFKIRDAEGLGFALESNVMKNKINELTNVIEL